MALSISEGLPSNQVSGLDKGTIWDKRFATFHDGRFFPETIKLINARLTPADCAICVLVPLFMEQNLTLC